MLPFIATLLLTDQKGSELALKLDEKSHFSFTTESFRTQIDSKVLYFSPWVRLTAKGASQSIELERSGNSIIVRFIAVNGNPDSPNDALELPIQGDKPFVVSFDAASKHYRLAQPRLPAKFSTPTLYTRGTGNGAYRPNFSSEQAERWRSICADF